MPDLSNYFLAITQIAIAMTGFAGLVSVFGGRTLTAASKEQMRTRFRMLLVLSLLAAFLPYVPFVLSSYGLIPAHAWLLASIVFLVSLVFNSVFFYRRGYDGATASRQVTAAFKILSSILYYGPFLLLPLGMLGIGPIQAHYLSSLLLILLVSAIMFFRIVVSLLTNEEAN